MAALATRILEQGRATIEGESPTRDLPSSRIRATILAVGSLNQLARKRRASSQCPGIKLVHRLDFDVSVPNRITMILETDMAFFILAELFPFLELAGGNFFVPIVAS
ncbi:MAG: hypothetical protein ACI814_002769 [Mariniblastus sp.]|jgi:hypothetical protein